MLRAVPKPIDTRKVKRINGRIYKTIKCTICKEKFERRSDQINVRNYCSKECMSKGLRNGKYKQCKQCRSSFYVRPSESKKGGKFCSKKCYTQWVVDNKYVPENFISSTNNAGENNGRYRHGKRVGGYISKKKLREEVINRDGGNWCLICGKPGPGLHLHRIKYGSQGGKYELDNCVQLCPIHHEEVHSSKKKWMPKLLEHIDRKKKRYGQA